MAIGIRAHYVYLDPVDPSLVPNGAMFLDSTNANTATVKSTGGSVDPVGDTSASLFIKQMVAGAAFAINAPLSKRSDGKVILADSDGAGTQELIGHALQSSAGDGSLVNVLTVGANITGALTGLGYTTGQEIYISEGGGFTNDPDSFTGSNDSIIRVGVADCATGIASGTAVDLIVITQIVIRP